MKNYSAAALALVASSSYIKAELYDFILPNGAGVYHFTSFDIPLTAAIYDPNNSSWATTAVAYSPGLVITRKAISVKAGTEAGSADFTFSPQFDYALGPVTILGFPFLQACRLGFFDQALLRMSKLFMPNAFLATGNVDTSAGAVAWFEGTCEQVQVGRQTAKITVDDYLAYMGTQQMPRNVYRVGCGHTVYDPGCDPTGSVKAAQLVSTVVAGTPTDGAHFNVTSSAATGKFSLGRIKFTSGALAGFSGSIASATLSGSVNQLVLRYPLPGVPATGDACQLLPGCDLMRATCINTFGNLAHYSGTDFVPQPETLLDGGTDTPPSQTVGSQAGQLIGSSPSSNITRGPYRT